MTGHRVKSRSLISTRSDLVNSNCCNLIIYLHLNISKDCGNGAALCVTKGGAYVLSSPIKALLDWNLEIRPKPGASSDKIVESLLAVVIGFHLFGNKTSWLALGKHVMGNSQ